MRERGSVARLVTALFVAGVTIFTVAGAGAIPYEAVEFEKLRALIEAAKKNGEFSEEEAHRAMSLLGLRRSDTTTIIAFAVGESQGDDDALCQALRARLGEDGISDAFITLALLKKELRGKPVPEKVEAFRALLDDENGFVRMEAAKEIARIDAEKGKEALRPLMNAGREQVDSLVIAEAARHLYEMGERDPGLLRTQMSIHAGQFEGMMAVIEGKLPLEYAGFWNRIPARLLAILEEVRETGELSGEQVAYVVECVGEGSQVTPQAKHVVSAIIYSKLREPCSELLKALEASLRKDRDYYGLPHGLITVAMVKDETRGQSDGEVAEALDPLTKHENPYLRVEAAKEIARLEPEKGKEELRRLYDTDQTWIVQGEAARVLEKMGEEMPYGAAHRHFWDVNFFYMTVLKLIEDEPLW
ncbi:MAG: HEAT repeat domain-containing protein [bacterium]|nr:HEAT repeat domain-containing protein [bacterium]